MDCDKNRIEIAFEMDKIPPNKQYKIFEAEIKLKEAGIFFDTVYDISDHEHVWKFDHITGPVHMNHVLFGN